MHILNTTHKRQSSMKIQDIIDAVSKVTINQDYAYYCAGASTPIGQSNPKFTSLADLEIEGNTACIYGVIKLMPEFLEVPQGEKERHPTIKIISELLGMEEKREALKALFFGGCREGNISNYDDWDTCDAIKAIEFFRDNQEKGIEALLEYWSDIK